MNTRIITSKLRGFGWSIAVAAVTQSLPGAVHAGVVPGDRFFFAVSANAYGGTPLIGYAIATFGITETFAGLSVFGDDYTVTSYEVVGSTTTTDFFKVSTPTTFVPSTSSLIYGVRLDIGRPQYVPDDYTVNFSSPITAYTAAANVVYGTGNAVSALNPFVTLGNGGLSLQQSVNFAPPFNGGAPTPVGTLAPHEFNFSITYANAVPEASTGAMAFAGIGLVGSLAARRRKFHLV